jgi:hypothetical protein
MAREILSKRNFFDYEPPDSAISRFPDDINEIDGFFAPRAFK